MTERRRPAKSLFAIVAISLCLFDGWAFWQWAANRQQALDATSQLESCQDLALEIEMLRLEPLRADEGTRSSDSLAALVQKVAKTTGLNPDRIVHISPTEPRRVADSPYQEQTTDVELREISLRQLIEFTLTIADTSPGLHVPKVALGVPPGSEKVNGDKEMWNAQLMLTSHIYAPKIPPLSPK